MWITVLIFAWVYLVMAVGRCPGTRIDRTAAALLGAAAICLLHQHSLAAAMRFVDLSTLFALFVFMLLGVIAQQRGAITCLTQPLLHRAWGPRRFLACVMAVTALLSMVMINDVVVVLLTPIVIRCAQQLKQPLLPLLLGTALASNLGSAASVVGNPQNLLLADAAGLSLLGYAQHTLLPVLLSLLGTWLLLLGVFRQQFKLSPATVSAAPSAVASVADTIKAVINKPDTNKAQAPAAHYSACILALLIAGFIGGMLLLPSYKVPLLLAVFMVLLLLSPQSLNHVWPKIDWSVLFLITGLFVVTNSSAAHLPLTQWPWLHQVLAQMAVSEPVLIGVSAVASNSIGNVPAVILLLSLPIELTVGLATQLAYYTTVTGNLFLNGSLASIIVAEIARQHGYIVRFTDFLKVGIPSVIVAVLLGISLAVTP